MKKLMSILLGLCIAVDASGEEATVRFERVTGEKSGVASAIQNWHSEEMARQGGPGKSHGWWPWGLRAFDFDGDGVLDLLASHHGVPHSMLLRGSVAKDGSFQFTDVTKKLGIDTRDLPGADDRPWIWDFDGDGRLDIGGFSDESRPNCIWNRGNEQLQVMAGFSFSPLSHPREVIDLNGDGFLDLDGSSRGCWFYDPEKKTFRHDPKPRFTVPDDVPSERWAAMQEIKKTSRGFYADALTHDLVGYDTLGYHPAPIDLDADGRNDVVLAGSGGYGAPYRATYLFREADGTLVDRTADAGLPAKGAPIYIRDLTGDGLPEILVVADKAGELSGGFFLNEGRRKFRRMDDAISKFLDRRGPYLIRAYQTDFDNDGLPDLVLSNPRLGQMVVFQNHGEGKFAEVLKLTGCWDSNPIVVTDFDGDGRVDLAVGLRPEPKSPGDIHLFLNRTESSAHHLTILPRMAAPNPFAVGAVVEVFAAGDAAKQAARPLFVEKAHADATPVLVGLGERKACDVRVTFPGGAVVVKANVPADGKLTVTP